MQLKYVGHKLAKSALKPFQKNRRAARMRRFCDVMEVQPGTRIIDMGGAASFWADCEVPLKLTIVNLPGILNDDPLPPQHDIRLIEGDACAMDFVDDQSFDIAFSNSVIEHVGPVEKQEAFAAEAHRVAPCHWIQTPSIWFPIEAHNQMPFWWFYPEPVKRRFIESWRRKLPAWTEMIDGTTVLLRRDIERMFPQSEIWVERLAGWAKSYVAYRRRPAAEGQ